jgi:uncharacterized delta-60 repeat protein
MHRSSRVDVVALATIAALLAACSEREAKVASAGPTVVISALQLFPASASVGEGGAYVLGAFDVAPPETGTDVAHLTVVQLSGAPQAVDFVEGDGSTVWFGVIFPAHASAVLPVSVSLRVEDRPASNVLTAEFAVTQDLDLGFGLDGVVVRDDDAFHEWTHAIALQPDGRIVVGGEITPGAFVDRYLAGGSPDLSFSDDGRFVFPPEIMVEDVRAIAVQPNGDILVAGVGAPVGYSLNQAMVARLRPDGTLDAAFGTGGIARTSYLYGAQANAIALQPDGKIVIAGWISFASYSEALVARFTADGAFDTAFGTGGIFQYAGPMGTGEAFTGVAVDADGRIVVTGTSPSGGLVGDPPRVIDPGSRHSLALRLTPDGVLDPTFAGDGTLRWRLLEVDEPRGVAIQPEGRIVVGGGTSNVSSMASMVAFAAGITPAGALDETFGDEGLFWSRPLAPYGMFGTALAMSTAGEPVLVGYRGSQAVVIRLTPDGELERSFSADGFAAATTYGMGHGAAVAVQPDDKVVVAGWSTGHDGTSDPGVLLVRFVAPSR